MPKLLPIAVLVLAGVVIVVGLIGVQTNGWPLAFVVAAFLVCFALGKGLLGVGKLLALAAVAKGGPDPRAEFAKPVFFWLYVTFKLLTWAVGWAVAGYLLGHPEAFTNR